jgi:hypothetical protein
MKYLKEKKQGFALAVLLLLLFSGVASQQKSPATASPLASLLPQLKNWKLAEEPRPFRQETLFEYIDGAAEVYLSYDFQELLVAQFQEMSSKASMTLEIYDMGNGRNAFGIYSAERYPESHFLPIGNQGYLDEGALNFLAGRYYVKLLCFEAGSRSEELLAVWAKDVAGKIKDPGGLPDLLTVFPKDGLIANGEKFVLSNFLGYKFLANGFIANYKVKDLEFDCFFIEGKSEEDAEAMLKQYLDHFNKIAQPVNKIAQPGGQQGDVFHVQDPYLKHVFLARAGKYLCGVTKIKDDSRDVGQKYLEAMRTKLKGKNVV